MTEFTGWANAAGSSLPTTKPSFENSTLSKAFRSCYRSWLPAWSDYLKAVSLFITPKTFADTLRRRLINVAERGLISREGNFYAITGRPAVRENWCPCGRLSN